MYVIREPCPVLEGEFALVVRKLYKSTNCHHLELQQTYHRVRKSSRNSHHHPPHKPRKEVFPLSPHQAAHQPPIQLRNIQTDERPQHQKDTMTDEQPQLLTPPPRNANLQQPQQILKELPIQLHLLSARRLALRQARPRPLPRLRLPQRRRFLLGDGIPNSTNEGDEESEVDGAGNPRAVLQVAGRELVDDALDSAVGGNGVCEELRLRGHGDVELSAAWVGGSQSSGALRIVLWWMGRGER